MQRSRSTRPSGRSRAKPRAKKGDIRSYAFASFGLVALALTLLIGIDFLRNPTATGKVSPKPDKSATTRDPVPETALLHSPEGASLETTSQSPVAAEGGGGPSEAENAAKDEGTGGGSGIAWAPDPSALQDAALRLSRSPARTGDGTQGSTRSSGRQPGSVAETASYRRPSPQPSPAAGPRLVFIIDDAGNNLSQLEPFLRLPFPLTIAVLPGLPYSQEAARRILAAGKELILHQPMEALGGQDPGPRAITLEMAPEAAAQVVRANLDSLPGAVGMNNHEGSAVTRDDPLMTAIVGVAKKRGIYYLDSLTIPETATPVVAARAGIRYWERDVFLDNSPDRVSIVHYIDVGRKKAEKTGSAIMIGHVWSAELAQTLSELYPQLVAEGFSLSTISRVMLEEADAGPGD